MRSIILSCFDKMDIDYKEYLDEMLIENEAYKTRDKIDVLQSKEIEFLEFMIKSYENSNQFPSQSLFEINFPELQGANAFSGVPEIKLDDFRVYISNLFSRRLNKVASRKVIDVNKDIEKNGITDESMETLQELQKLTNKNKVKDIQLQQDFKSIYAEKMTKPIGLKTFIKPVDERIGGISEGSITTIAGYTSHYKTTFAMNIAMENAYEFGYNLAYFSLETPKEDVLFNQLCRHSYRTKFSKYNYVPHDKIRKCMLSDEEKEFLEDVDTDMYADYTDTDGTVRQRGKIIVLDEGDFDTFSFTEIYNVLETIDKKLNGTLDGFIVDYIQLCKFTDSRGWDDNRVINGYVSFFRKLTQKFRSGAYKKKLIGILLSQINRGSWQKASRKDGRYDLTCLADANELERGSHRVLTTYTTEEMKLIKEAQVQILKNRNGPTMWEPEKVYADGEAFVFGEEFSSFGQTFGGSMGSSLGDALGDLGDLGGLM